MQGNEAKVLLDVVVDACAAMQNLREGIFSYRLGQAMLPHAWRTAAWTLNMLTTWCPWYTGRKQLFRFRKGCS
jgi:hypothetical protein